MITTTIIGTGNVAWHLAKACAQSEKIELLNIIGRNSKQLSTFEAYAPTGTDFKVLPQADLVIAAVADDALATVAKKLPRTNALVVHTSGSVALKALQRCKNHGVLYPLQTFTKTRFVDLHDVPFCIEANSAENREKLGVFAGLLSSKVTVMDSRERALLHLSAVMANNFCNHLLTLTHSFCNEKNLPFSLLQNLMGETVAKAFEIGPKAAQTGPARRGDYDTLQKHLSTIHDQELKDIYIKLTNSIFETYGKGKL